MIIGIILNAICLVDAVVDWVVSLFKRKRSDGTYRARMCVVLLGAAFVANYEPADLRGLPVLGNAEVPFSQAVYYAEAPGPLCLQALPTQGSPCKTVVPAGTTFEYYRLPHPDPFYWYEVFVRSPAEIALQLPSYLNRDAREQVPWEIHGYVPEGTVMLKEGRVVGLLKRFSDQLNEFNDLVAISAQVILGALAIRNYRRGQLKTALLVEIAFLAVSTWQVTHVMLIDAATAPRVGAAGYMAHGMVFALYYGLILMTVYLSGRLADRAVWLFTRGWRTTMSAGTAADERAASQRELGLFLILAFVPLITWMVVNQGRR